MPDTLIENPILNSPYREPTRHFRFGDEGITNEIIETRRASAYFVPIPPPEKKSKQLHFDTEWTKDRIETNDKVDRIRERVKHWRKGDYQGITQVTRNLLQHWTDADRENKLFFCQVEALETLIDLTESARKVGDHWIENQLRDANNSSNLGLKRVAIKGATGPVQDGRHGPAEHWARHERGRRVEGLLADQHMGVCTVGVRLRGRPSALCSPS
jgi:type III restriction enzyme